MNILTRKWGGVATLSGLIVAVAWAAQISKTSDRIQHAARLNSLLGSPSIDDHLVYYAELFELLEPGQGIGD